tara:strand:- start:1058 stop:1321 length:264 start_codon:yes stop_codon:yes gene_type:complete
MSTAAAKKGDDRQQPSQKSTAVLLLMIAADTTWRMFVPIIGGTVLGVWLDNVYQTKPLLTIALIGVGVIIASLLVWQQMKKGPVDVS